jgi:hypothetical protein
MALGAITFWVASAIHFGARIPVGFTTLDDPFPGAAIPEAIVGVVLAAGAFTIFIHWHANWGAAVGTTAFAILVTLYGLSITAGSGRTPDVGYHVAILVLLFCALGLLLLGRRGRVGH